MLAIHYKAYGLKGIIYAAPMSESIYEQGSEKPLFPEKHTATGRPLNRTSPPIHLYQQTLSAIANSVHELGKKADIFVDNNLAIPPEISKQLYALHPSLRVYNLEPHNMQPHPVYQEYLIKCITDKSGYIRINSKTQQALQLAAKDGAILAMKLAIQLSLGIGPLSGINLLGAILLQQHFGIDQTVVTVFPDSYQELINSHSAYASPLSRHCYSDAISFLEYTVIKKPPGNMPSL